ncbi:hypothetical protein L7F22_061048 [Adiantum nelumboides]|nr:hypothetical protein [Adiantum nelumboides]
MVVALISLLPAGTSFYGTGEVSGPLERSGQRVFTWNSDAWGYGPSTTSLYQSHPWVLAVLPDGKALGLLADTTRRCEVDLRKKSLVKFVASSPYPVVTFGPFASPAAVLQSLSHAIGTIDMPPKWSLGYHQCRWSYEPDFKVLEVARTFREKKIPCDVLWMDIDYMDGFRCFTFDPKKFASPNELGRDLHSNGFKAVWMLDPGIKAEAGYSVYDSGTSQDAWIYSSRKQPYVGEVWPGPCVFPDFTSKATRQWWAELVSKFVSDFIDGIWNDVNEPTVFKNEEWAKEKEAQEEEQRKKLEKWKEAQEAWKKEREEMQKQMATLKASLASLNPDKGDNQGGSIKDGGQDAHRNQREQEGGGINTIINHLSKLEKEVEALNKQNEEWAKEKEAQEEEQRKKLEKWKEAQEAWKKEREEMQEQMATLKASLASLNPDKGKINIETKEAIK